MFRTPIRLVVSLAAALATAPATSAQTHHLTLHDLSESARAFRFTTTDNGAHVTLLPAATWDALEFEVRGAELGVPLLFVVPGADGKLNPEVTTGDFLWRAARVLPGESTGELRFVVAPTRARFTVRLGRTDPPGQREAPYYQYSRFTEYIAQIAQEPRAQLTQIGTSLQGRPLYRILIDEPSSTHKKTVLMVVRQHGDEDGSSYLLEGALDLLLGRGGLTPDPELLTEVRWIIYPMMNPDGAVARSRGNANGIDLNRDWDRNGCNAGQQQETFVHQCDIEAMHALYDIAIAGDHHGWGLANHGGFRYAQGQAVSFVTAPEYQEARKDTTVITRHDPTQFAWQENGGTTGMIRAEMFLRFGFLLHTPEYNSSISTAAQFHLKGQQWDAAMHDTLYAVEFTDAAGVPTRFAVLPGQLWVAVDDDDENLSASVSETVRVVVVDRDTRDEETLTLTETGPNTGVFRNTTPLPLTSALPVTGNGRLESVPRSKIRAIYTDDDYPRDRSTSDRDVVRGDTD